MSTYIGGGGVATDQKDRPMTRGEVEDRVSEVGGSDKLKLNGRNLTQIDFSNINLTGADLREVDLSEANLHGAILVKADLQGANLSAAIVSDANLTEANLSNAIISEANLSRTNFTQATLTQTNLMRSGLAGAQLPGAILRGSNLHEATLSEANLEEANLSEADLSEAKLDKANLRHADLRGANLRKALLNDAVLNHADLSGADLSEANLSEADLSGARLHWAIINGTTLTNAGLRNATLKWATLSNVRSQMATLEDANLDYATLSNTDLYRAHMSGASLHSATLSETKLSEADLREADLREVTLRNVELSGANLSGANLSRAYLFMVALNGTKLDFALLDKTILIQSTLEGANLLETDLSRAYISQAEKNSLRKREKQAVIGLDETKDEAYLFEQFPQNIRVNIDTAISSTAVTDELEKAIRQVKRNVQSIGIDNYSVIGEIEDQVEVLTNRALEIESQAKVLDNQEQKLINRVEVLKTLLVNTENQEAVSDIEKQIEYQDLYSELENSQEQLTFLKYSRAVLVVEQKQLALHKTMLELECERVNLPYEIVEEIIEQRSPANMGLATRTLLARALFSKLLQSTAFTSKERDLAKEVAKTMESRATQQIPISLQAFAGVTNTKKQQVFLNKEYYVRAGIVPDPRNMKESIMLDILLHSSDNIELLAGWYRQLNYDPNNPKSQLTEFTIRPKEAGKSTLVVDFYYEQCWLKTIRLQFEAKQQTVHVRSSH